MSQVAITDDGLGQLLGSTESFTSHGGFATYKTPIANPSFRELMGALVIPFGPNYVLPSFTRPAFKHTPRAPTKNLEFETTIKNETGAILNIQPGVNWNFTAFALPIDTACTLKVICLNSVCYGYILLSNTATGSGDPLESVPTRTWGAGSGRTFSLSLDNVGIGDAVICNGTRSVSIGSTARTSSADCVSLGYNAGAAAITSAACTLIGTQAHAGAGNLAATCLGYNAIVDGNFGVSIGASTQCRTNGICISGTYGGALSGGNNGVVIGYLSSASGDNMTICGYLNRGGQANNCYIFGYGNGNTNLGGSFNLLIGENNGTTILAGQSNQLIGYNNSVANPTTNNALVFGSNCQAGISAGVIGRTSTALGTNSYSVGNNNAVPGQNSFAWGNNLVVNGSNAFWFGNDQNSVAYFTGFAHSRKCLSAAAGYTGADPGQVLAPANPTFANIAIQSVRYNNGMVIDAPNQRIQLGYFGTFPQDSESSFLITAQIAGFASNSGSTWAYQLVWIEPTNFPGGVTMGEVVLDTVNANLTNATITQVITIPPNTTGENYVFTRITRISGVGNVTLGVYRLTVTRLV